METLTELAEKCMEDARGYLADTTLKSYRWFLRCFVAWIGEGAQADRLTEERLGEYLDYLVLDKTMGGKGYRPRAARVIWHGVAYFCAWLTEKKIVEKNPFPRKRLPRLDQALRPKTTEGDVRAMLSACEGLAPYPRALGRACIYLMFTSLVRRNEMLQIRLSHLHLEDTPPWIQVYFGKGSKERPAYLADDCAAALREYLAVRPKQTKDDHFLHQNNYHWRLGVHGLYSLLGRIAEAAGVKDPKTINPHAMRRGGAGRLTRRGADIEVVSKKLGHTSIATTQIYVESGNDEQIAIRNLTALAATQAVVSVALPPPAAPDPPPAPALRPVDAVPATSVFGWICPRCSAVHGPMIQHCHCTPPRPAAPTPEPGFPPAPKPIQ